MVAIARLAPCVALAAALTALAATSAFASTTPEQIHVAFAGSDASGNADGMAISWATGNPTATSTVQFGTSPGSLTQSATGTSVAYLPPATHHHVVLSGLKSSTTYYYAVGDVSGGFSEVLSFSTAAGSDVRTFSLAMFGDLGYGSVGHAVATRNQLDALSDQYDWVMHAGDISYADDAFLHTPLSFEYENVYNNYMNWMQNVTASKGYMVLPGNHESECHSPACLLDSTYKHALQNFTAYNARFRMPFQESGGAGLNMWYSFNYGSAHFVAFDTETDYTGAPEETHGDSGVLPAGGFAPSGAQLAWFEADLAKAAANRKERPWIIVTGHRPIYSTKFCDANGNPTGDCATLQKTIEDLLFKYNVDVYFSGHVHAYQRTFPVYNNNVTTSYSAPPYPVHLIVGGAGCDEMDPPAQADLGLTTGVEWLANANANYGMGIVNIVNDTQLAWRWFDSTTGAVVDQVVLNKAPVA